MGLWHGIQTRVLICHPDKGGDAADFRAVVAAYNVLSDPEARAKCLSPQPQAFTGDNEPIVIHLH